jgi:hypothetical protein
MRRNYKMLVGKPEGSMPFRNPCVYGRITLKWDEDVNWMHLAQDRVRGGLL